MLKVRVPVRGQVCVSLQEVKGIAEKGRRRTPVKKISEIMNTANAERMAKRRSTKKRILTPGNANTREYNRGQNVGRWGKGKEKGDFRKGGDSRRPSTVKRKPK